MECQHCKETEWKFTALLLLLLLVLLQFEYKIEFTLSFMSSSSRLVFLKEPRIVILQIDIPSDAGSEEFGKMQLRKAA